MYEKSLSDLSILMVEPSRSQAKFIHRELKKAGIINFEIAIDGESAIKNMSQFRPDLVISTMYLPEMTGAELLLKMRDDEELKDVAFMLISSETGFEQIDPIRQAGVTAILPKPFDLSQLKRGLYNTLDILNPSAMEIDDLNIEDLKVLVVDDSLMARNHIKRVLKGLGIENITEADDGASAVPILEAHFFDFIVTDYNMPQMDGKALLEHIRNSSNQRSIPVLMVTSEGNEGNLAAVEQAGVSGICDKPFEADTVREMIRVMMSEV
ncbi:Chemotaxis regulator - transmits chemoreceptor signals to flagellar motor components CheY [hydrothermal vent metagenome]|uniref:Chemotaxis regulator - transmits chemoreceptor signals to flagellar motor components CheY n=1 Tax=hydrothermal vent metagenome TaxID=652676 RepID=A0A3B0Y1F8_9ZZZZ